MRSAFSLALLLSAFTVSAAAQGISAVSVAQNPSGSGALVPGGSAQEASPSASTSLSANEAKFIGSPADLRVIGGAFSSNPAFKTIELSGLVSQPFDPTASPTSFVITVDSDGATETRIKTNAGEFWERYPAAGSLGTCSSSMDRPDQPARRTSLRCSSPVSWVLPGATLQSSERVARIQSATQAASDKNQTTAVTLWIGNSPDKPASSDPVKRYTARQLTIDRTSQLPSSLRYEEAPVGPVAATYSPPTIEIRYSDYRNVSGFNIPFRIDKLRQDQVLSSFQVDNVSVR